MRTTRSFSLLGLLLLCFGVSAASAFHDGGVGSCSGCHTIHNSQDGIAVDSANPTGNPWTLIAETPSDVCLSCHANQYGAVFGDDPLLPPPERGPGNFVFLYEDNLGDGEAGEVRPLPGDRAGHNIIAPSKGVGADMTWLTSPGGNFPSSDLGCTSCHDPHGNGEFRFLHGAGPIMGGQHVFSEPAPLAEGIPLDAGVESPTNHTAYHSGMSRWCGNCHGLDYHDQSSSNFEHPADENLESKHIRRYNRYNGTDDQMGGTFATAYLPEVSLQDPSFTTSSTHGAGSQSEVHCLTCHRAHATSGPWSGRWDFFLVDLNQDGVVSGSYPIPNPYPAQPQDRLCLKCHPPGWIHDD